MINFKSSIYQENIYGFVPNGKGHGIVNAVAGSGKTTTLVEALKLTSGNAIFLAFNKSIATELSQRVPSHCKTATLHSVGNSILKQSSSATLDQYKIDNIMDGYTPLALPKFLKFAERSAILEVRQMVKQMVSLIKNTMIDYTDRDALIDVAVYYGLDFNSSHIPYVQYVIEKSNEISNRSIDFDDMVYLPVLNKMNSRYTYDWVFVDEAQDLNKTQIELVLKIVTPITGRIICVGDPKQSIYGFRGADVGAMDRLKEVLNATELPLSVCYRCPSSHLDMARQMVPQIENKPDAIVGEIAHIKEKNFADVLINEEVEKTIILSRTNASLVTYALKLIAQGYKATIKGRDIGRGLVSLVKKMNATDMYELELKLKAWKTKEIDKHNARHHEAAIQGVCDRFDCVYNVMADCTSILEVISKLETLFNDQSNSGYIFSSVHRAKGLEAETVYILNPHKLPLIWKGQKQWELEQEMNIKYVCLTRSKNRMVFVHSDSAK